MFTTLEAKEKYQYEHLCTTYDQACSGAMYNEHFNGFSRPQQLRDIAKLPFTTKQDLRDHYPYQNLSVSFDSVVQMHSSSGTTGRPTNSFFTQKDLDDGTQALARAWKNFGVNERSRVQFLMSYGLFSGAYLNTFPIQKLGGFVLPAGIIPTAKHLTFIKDYDIDMIVATPSYFMHMYDHAVRHNFSFADTNLQTGIIAGEPSSLALKKRIEDAFGIRLFDYYGLCEVNTGIIYECNACGNMVVLDDYIYAEVVAPESDRVCEVGEQGELVLTSLQKEASPIIRYRTGDLITKVSDFSDCVACAGATLLSRVVTRHDAIIFYKGLKLDPFDLKDKLLDSFTERIFSRMHIEVTRQEEINTNMCLVIAPRDTSLSIEEIQKKVHELVGISVSVRFVEDAYFGEFKTTKGELVVFKD